MMKQVWYPGDKFPNGWEISSIIDSGGMGTVYIVNHPKFDLPLAAKTFKQDFFSSPSAIERFRQEAEIWVLLGDHPHIVEAQFVETIEGKPYIFMEYIPGSSLRELLWKKLDLRQSLAFAIQFCEGMKYVHTKELLNGRKGLVHRDIKPENVLISVGDILKITDFGLAKSLTEQLDIVPNKLNSVDKVGLSHTKAGDLIGTPAYMSPEHFLDAGRVDKLSDIYSFGVVLFEMVTGHRPFWPEGREKAELIASLKDQHLNRQPPSPRSLIPSLPDALDLIVLSCLEKKPGLRPTDFENIQEALQEIFIQITGFRFELPQGPERDRFKEAWKRAKTFYNLGKWQDAVAWSEKALDLAPDSDRNSGLVWTIKGLAHCDLGEYDEALRCFDRSLALGIEGDVAWNNKGIVYWDQKDYKKALNCFDQAIQFDPEDWEAFQNKGAVLDTIGRHEEALTWFDRALEINSRHVNSWASKGGVLQKLGRYDEAIESEEEALSINPRCAEAINNMTVIYLRRGLYIEALEWADRLIEVNPNFPSYWQNKATILIGIKQYDQAVQVIDEGLAFNPSHRYRVKMLEIKLLILNEVAHIRRTPNDYHRVYDCIKELLALDPDNELGKTAKTEVDAITPPDTPISAQEATHPAKILNPAIQIFPKSDGSKAKELNLKGEKLLNMLGDIEGAISCFKSAIECDPELMDSYNNMGVALEMQDKIDEAIEYYDLAIKLTPDFYMAWYNKGNCYMNKGAFGKNKEAFEKSLECYDRALELNPDFVNIWVNKGAVLMLLGRFKEAMDYYNRALDLDPGHPAAQAGKKYCEEFLSRMR